MENPHIFPGSSQRHQARLVLDAALLLWRRSDQRQYIRFGGADASPQCGFDFLLSSSDYILKSEIVQTFLAIQRMIQESQARSFGPQSDESKADHAVVKRNVLKEDDIPVALGHGATSASNKCAAMVYKWFMRCDSKEMLQEYMGSFFSFTADLGTEIHMPGFHVRSVDDLLPAWMQQNTLSSDIEDGHAVWCLPVMESDVADGQYGQQEPAVNSVQVVASDSSSGKFLPNSLVVPGMLHITSNALERLADQLAHFPIFFQQLRLIEQLWKQGRLSRFVNFCIHPVASPEVAAQFQKRKLGSLYLKRWNEVCRFCMRLKDLLPLLTAFWNEVRFNSSRRSSVDAEFDPSELTKVLGDRLFHAYFDMVLSLATILEELGQWCERCPCHQDLLSGASDVSAPGLKRKRDQEDPQRKTSISKLYGCAKFACPMRGKMFPELVGDGLHQIVAGLSSRGSFALLLGHKQHLTDEAWTLLMQDFVKGKATIDLELSVKLAFCEKLPWRLALLAHSNLAMVRRELSRVVHEYDSLPEKLQEHHHVLTRKALDKASDLRTEMDRFLAGQEMSALPQLLQFAASFRFVQITERYFEASHAIVKRKVNPNGAGPVVSLTRRLFRLANDISIHPRTLEEVALHYETARDLKLLPARLGLVSHPDLSGLVGQKRVNWKVIKVLNKVLYRTDTIGQFPNVDAAEEYDNKQAGKLQAIGEKLVLEHEPPVLKGPVRGSYESLRLEALQQHVSLLSEERPQSLFHLRIRRDRLPFAVQDFVRGWQLNIGFDCDIDVMEPERGKEPQNSKPDSADETMSLFFQVVNTNPSSRKVVETPLAATLSSKLKSRDIAINTFAVSIDDDKVPWLKCSPQEGSVSAVQVLRDLSQLLSFQELCENLRVGEPGKDSLYFVDGLFDYSSMQAKRVAELVSVLIDHGAYPNLSVVNASNVWHVFSDLREGDEELLCLLLEHGLLDQDADGRFRATAALLSDLRLCRSFHDKSSAAYAELSSPSIHDLLNELESAGFQWRRLKPKEILFYEIGKEKVWGTRGVTICKEFLHCLVKADFLHTQFGLTRIPCVANKSTYEAILEGKKTDFDVSDRPVKALQLADDVDMFDHVPDRKALVNDPMPVLADNDMDCLESFSQTDTAAVPVAESGDSLLDTLLEFKAVETDDFYSPGSPVPTPPDLPAQDSPSNVPENVGNQNQQPQLDEAQSSFGSASNVPEKFGNQNQQPQLDEAQSSFGSAPVAPASQAAQVRKPRDLTNYTWGAFRFTYKQTDKQVALQATCPFHGKNLVTGCKKSMNVTPFTDERLQEVTRLLKHWCNSAKSFERQSTHLAMPLDPDSCPELSIVEAQIIAADQKPESIKTDKELDAALASPKTPKPTSKAAVKAKAKGKPRAKAKAKARAGHQTDNKEQSESSSSDSDTQNDGSGQKSSSSSSSSSSDSSSGSSEESSS